MPQIIVDYTSKQINEGIIGANGLPAPLTASFRNPSSGSAYFFIEQYDGQNEYNMFPSGSGKMEGTFNNLQNIDSDTIINEEFKIGIIVPPGSSSMIYVPDTINSAIRERMVGTGTFDMTVEINF